MYRVQAAIYLAKKVAEKLGWSKVLQWTLQAEGLIVLGRKPRLRFALSFDRQPGPRFKDSSAVVQNAIKVQHRYAVQGSDTTMFIKESYAGTISNEQ